MRTKKDANQIIKDEHDESSKAKRIKIIDTEMSMELNHADGDSVTAHPAKLSASAIGVDSNDDDTVIIPALDCSSISIVRVHIEGDGDVHVEISLSDTHDSWIDLGYGAYHSIDICARRIRIRSKDAVGDVHLCGRS